MMGLSKICRGCFKEWVKEDTACSHCGWEPEQKYEAVLEWTIGDLFEKRYMLGMLYCQSPDAAIWRIYDTALGISYFALRTAPEDEKRLYLLAEQMNKSDLLLDNQICVMAVKRIGEKMVLLFSVLESAKNVDALEHILSEKTQSQDEWNVWSKPKDTPQKEQTLPTGTSLNDRYLILDCIGIGGFGIVYLCRDMYLQRFAAVKEYFPAEWVNREEQQYVTVKKSQFLVSYQFGLKSFYQEAKIMAKFIHAPHIATIYDVMEANDTAYLVMEYISGISIGREMRRRDYRPYHPKEVKEILFPVLETLSIIHEKRIIHSDISPGNIIRSWEGEPFLVDMGAAKYTSGSQPVLSASFLKPNYAAPEQYQTAKEGIPKNEGPWTDLYALGATAYYLLTGQKPPDVIQRLKGIKTEVAFPKGRRFKKKKQWMNMINHAMALEIRERMQSVEEFEEEMKKLTE